MLFEIHEACITKRPNTSAVNRDHNAAGRAEEVTERRPRLRICKYVRGSCNPVTMTGLLGFYGKRPETFCTSNFVSLVYFIFLATFR